MVILALGSSLDFTQIQLRITQRLSKKELHVKLGEFELADSNSRNTILFAGFQPRQHGPQTSLVESLQYSIQEFNRVQASLMQQYDRAGFQAVFQDSVHGSRIAQNGVESPTVPQHHRQAERLQRCRQERVVMADRWTETAWLLAGDFQQSLLAAGDFGPHGVGPQTPEATGGMGLAVVADQVTTGGDGAHEFRMSPGFLANEKEAGAHAMP